MEQLLRIRMEMRRKRLEELVSESRSLFAAPEVSIEDLIRSRTLLKVALGAFEKEINLSMEKGASADDIEGAMKDLMVGESALSELAAVEEIYSSRAQNKGPEVRTKMPTLDLPKYNGDPLLFTQFWDKFEANVHNKPIADTDKFSYLCSCLEGEAYKAVEGFTTSNANYTLAVDKLRDRFGRQDHVVDSHFQALNKLPQAKHLASECRSNLDAIETHLRVLQTLGEDVESNHLRVTLKSKFPDSLMYQVHLRVGRDPTVRSIRDALDAVISAMENSTNKSASQQTSPAVHSTEPFATSTLHTQEERPKKSLKRKFEKKKPANRNTKKDKLSCLLCSGEHYASNCKKIKDVSERIKKLGNRCFRCLRPGHMARECKTDRTCYICKATTHHEVVCKKSKCNDTDEGMNEVTLNMNIRDEQIFLQTGVVTARGSPAEVDSRQQPPRNRTCRVLLDSGSQRSYITAKLTKELELVPKFDETLLIYTFGNKTPQEINCPMVELEIITKRGVNKRIEANIVPHITSKVPIPVLPANISVDLAADDGSEGEEIQLLIGNDFYFSFIRRDKKKVQENLFLIDTDCGWMLSGKAKENVDSLSVITYCQGLGVEANHLSEPDIPLREYDIRFLWTLESIGISDSPKITRDEETINHFNETVKFENGRYNVKWPWVTYPPDLVSNLGMAYGRLKSLWNRLDEPLKFEYDSIIKEQLQLGILEEIEPQTTTNPVHYLPHHLVKQEGKRGRIVYDASAKFKGQKSLNENMYRGPAMIEDLTALILKFRLHKIGITADIEKAFLTIGLQPEDRDVTRFLWLKDLNEDVTEDNLVHMRFCRVPFGIVASPFILTATIHYHLKKNEDLSIREIANNFYVDNLVFSTETTSEALKVIKSVRDVFQDISMNVRDWTSNDEKVLMDLPKECCSKDTAETKLLGLTWRTNQDTLKLRAPKILEKGELPKTKRELLSAMASVYDPCGLAAPLVVPAKLLIQELWKRKFNWDKTLPEELWDRLEDTLKLLRQAGEIEVPRYIGTTNLTDPEYELHGFTDASNTAYAAAVYLKVTDKATGNCTVNLIMAKSRVTPIAHKEDLKVPKLELLGYLIGARLICYVETALKIQVRRMFLWTDSLIVLCWLKSEKLLPPFVTRRVNEIKGKGKITYRFVNTHLNPADLATRPELWEEKKEVWFKGPGFLKEKEDAWPTAPNLNQVNLQVVAEGLNHNLEDIEEMEIEEEDTSKQDGDQEQSETDDFTMTDMDVTRIKKLQQEYFPEEIKGKQTSLQRNLGLFVDIHGVLRCEGKIMNTTCSYDVKHPILIPKESQFTEQLIKQIHEKNMHVGANHTLSILRQKYWIPGGRGSVQKVLRKCPQCVKHAGGPYKLPPTPALPFERANYSAPFTYTGMDYLGPIMVKEDMKMKKVWVCLYTCLAVRAIHLEVVKDLTAEECLMALRRFIAARGIPKVMVSDNAQQFRLTAEVLADRYCIENDIRWKFTPQLAPWHGGFYERLVGLVKNCLKRTLGKQTLNETQLYTVIKEVEAILNSRPLTYVGPDVEYVLKPADFLTFGKVITVAPATNREDPGGTVTKQDLIGSWRKGLATLEEFKKMFLGQYLCSLRERYQCSPKQPRVKSQKTPQVGEIVQIQGEVKNRELWKVGKIKELLMGQDGECRVAKVEVNGKEFTRSIGHLYPLEVEENKNIVINSSERRPSEDHEVPSSSVGRDKTRMNGSNLEDDPNIVEPVSAKEIPQDEPIAPELTKEVLVIPDEPEAHDVDVITETPEEEEAQVLEGHDRPFRTAALEAKKKIAQWARELHELLCL